VGERARHTAMPSGMYETPARVTGHAVAEFPRPNTWVVLAARVAHGLIALAFLGCIAVLYIDAWRDSMNVVTLAALAALWVEGVLVLVSGGRCPLEPFFRKLGDDTPFFELLLPPRAAELAVPALGAVSTLGAVLLGVRTL
jgi:hypothetical protein